MVKMTVSNKRIITHERKVTIPESMGLRPDDVVEFNLTDNGIVTLTKFVRSAEVPPELDEVKL